MPNTLVECVPNFSEGRDAAKVDAIVEAMKIPGVYLLDREMDSDHNRCVIALAIYLNRARRTHRASSSSTRLTP